MKWRTDKPTANVIVAYVWKSPAKETSGPCILYLAKQPYEYYYDNEGYMVAYGAIEKWADLEGGETVTNCYQYSAVEEELDAFIKSGKAIKEENCGTYTTTYIDPLKVARHFAKWGAEHLKNKQK